MKMYKANMESRKPGIPVGLTHKGQKGKVKLVLTAPQQTSGGGTLFTADQTGRVVVLSDSRPVQLYSALHVFPPVW